MNTHFVIGVMFLIVGMGACKLSESIADFFITVMLLFFAFLFFSVWLDGDRIANEKKGVK